MLHFFPSFTLGPISFFVIILNTLMLGIFLHIVALARLIVPVPSWQQQCERAILWMISNWLAVNDFNYWLTQKIEWDIAGLKGLSRNKWYLVTCNHQTWLDILVLLRIFDGHIPFPRFFLKQMLIWVPVVGTVAWALDMPFMKRYSRKVLQQHPELRGKDLETARKSCERFKERPVSILNFLEGTRFTPQKHARQESPYRHLLRPRAGGIAFALSAMGEYFDGLLDVTVIYPDGRATFWDFFSGKVPRIVVRVEQIAIPPQFLQGDYLNDPVFRDQFQAWVRELWDNKDALIEQTLQAVEERV